MPLMTGKGHVGQNITEFRGGKSFAHTENKFGKDRAEKQAVAVALHQQDKGATQSGDHKSAIAKMDPEQLHKLVQHAASGKAGPEMQQMAHQAMQSPAGTQEPDGDEGMPPRRSMFAGEPDGDEQQEQAPASTGSMFSGGR